MIAVTRFALPEEETSAFQAGITELLSLLAKQPGFVRGRVGRALDEQSQWVLTTEWDEVGSYRRGLGAYEVKLTSPPLMAWSVPEPSAFEVVAQQDEARAPLAAPSNRAR